MSKMTTDELKKTARRMLVNGKYFSRKKAFIFPEMRQTIFLSLRHFIFPNFCCLISNRQKSDGLIFSPSASLDRRHLRDTTFPATETQGYRISGTSRRGCHFIAHLPSVKAKPLRGGWCTDYFLLGESWDIRITTRTVFPHPCVHLHTPSLPSKDLPP